MVARACQALAPHANSVGGWVSVGSPRVWVPSAQVDLTADLIAARGRPQIAADCADAVSNPALIVEVLSLSTALYDRGEKWQHYRQIPSLQEYVLINTTQPLVEWYRRTPEGWLYQAASAGEQARLASIEVVLDVDRLYDGVFELEPTDG